MAGLKIGVMLANVIRSIIPSNGGTNQGMWKWKKKGKAERKKYRNQWAGLRPTGLPGLPDPSAVKSGWPIGSRLSQLLFSPVLDL